MNLLCKRCNIVMKSGTTYEHSEKKNKNYARNYKECPKCKDKIYAKTFQEIFKEEQRKHK